MFKGHPKELYAASLANMGERFGFYTMMAILLLFLKSKFGLSDTGAGWIYSVFYFSIYILAFVGGLIADKTRNFKGTILAGLVCMSLGYAMIGFPTTTTPDNRMALLIITCVGLFVIAFGNGLFKGNLQALIGQMYDNEKYGKLRDSGFQLFYMFINVGAIFAPLAAVWVRNWWVETNGYLYNASLPQLCHSVLDGTATTEQTAKITELASHMPSAAGLDLATFANQYLDVFNRGFQYAFMIAIGAMAISLVIYLANKSKFPNPRPVAVASDGSKPKVSAEELKDFKQRIWALIAVFAVVIFFWFSFHQNGVTLTLFAADYTKLELFGYSLSAEIFQSFNPFFVVFLTPVIVALFGWLRAKNMEPSTPKKIMIGMAIAASAFALMSVVSYAYDLPMKNTLATSGYMPDVTPWLLIGTYFVLTVAELFISPLGISFVSKVAPVKLQGLMQGGWLGATAIGNQLLVIGAILYNEIPVWLTWTVFVAVCVMSMTLMLVMLKWLERVSK